MPPVRPDCTQSQPVSCEEKSLGPARIRTRFCGLPARSLLNILTTLFFLQEVPIKCYFITYGKLYMPVSLLMYEEKHRFVVNRLLLLALEDQVIITLAKIEFARLLNVTWYVS